MNVCLRTPDYLLARQKWIILLLISYRKKAVEDCPGYPVPANDSPLKKI